MTDGNLRVPDMGFTRKDRLPGGKPYKGFPPFAPDIAVEIISPSESRPDMQRKVEEYFASGAKRVWYVFPEKQQVTVYTSPTDAKAFAGDDELDGGDVLPDFRCRVSEFFDFG